MKNIHSSRSQYQEGNIEEKIFSHHCLDRQERIGNKRDSFITASVPKQSVGWKGFAHDCFNSTTKHEREKIYSSLPQPQNRI
jgi:hypothetical protein